jgi:hypothetical protein
MRFQTLKLTDRRRHVIADFFATLMATSVGQGDYGEMDARFKYFDQHHGVVIPGSFLPESLPTIRPVVRRFAQCPA